MKNRKFAAFLRDNGYSSDWWAVSKRMDSGYDVRTVRWEDAAVAKDRGYELDDEFVPCPWKYPDLDGNLT